MQENWTGVTGTSDGTMGCRTQGMETQGEGEAQAG